jgi:hypothetical protein
VLPNEQEERQLALASELLSLFKSSPYYLADKIEKPCKVDTIDGNSD